MNRKKRVTASPIAQSGILFFIIIADSPLL
jgi:hypothetical protein